MNLQHILTEIEKVDPEVYDRLDSRRGAMQRFAFAGKVLAAAAVPFALGGMFNKAYGRSTATILEVLNYALTLEYLEAEFYTRVVATTGVIPAGPALGALTTIRDHENAHVNFLKTAITASGGTPVAKPTFDFSGGSFAGGPGTGNGPFKDAFTNYDLMLAVAQTFEDTGVRAYKGAAGDLISNNDVLTAALQIHSVEARHASHIRQMRKARGGALVVGDVKPWITLNQSGIASTAVQATYNGEEVTKQATIELVNINGKTISAAAASEAFDEPLTMAQVLAIVDGFIV
ncbi:MAG TPA: ferritin-like domain-containing protein [Chitinophagaceae bacterium]|nr:ferritin-like domain-containing protein [Chitinophagaceae bacterium]